jgi:DNA repair protein RecO (recombination protein O)
VSRNSVHSALILRSRPSGESNREIWLLTAGEGLLRVTVFGGPKSKLRSYASPFHSGQAWIYRDPVKDSRKLSDFDVRSWRPGLREMYERVTAADAVAETVLASHAGGGNWERALSLAESTLDALAASDGETCSRILLCFLWQWIDFLGLRPEFDRCSVCGKQTPSGIRLLYLPGDGGMACDDCAAAVGKNNKPQSYTEEYPESSSKLRVLRGEILFAEAGPGCRHWLETVRPLSPVQINRYTLDKKSFREAKTFVTAVLAEALGKRLNWDW